MGDGGVVVVDLLCQFLSSGVDYLQSVFKILGFLLIAYLVESNRFIVFTYCVFLGRKAPFTLSY